MNQPVTVPRRTIAPVLFTLAGVLIGLLISILAVWADYESTSYGFMKRANSPFRGLHCPILLGQNETGMVSIRVSNPTDRPLSPSVRTEVSTSQDLVSELVFLQLGPGEESAVRQTVGPENIDFGSFIFVSASVFSMYPLPDQENTCGIFVLPVSVRGSLVLVLGATVSLILMSVGSVFLYKRDAQRSRSILFMVLATALALGFSYAGFWVQPLLLIIVVLFTLLITSGSLLE